MGGVKDYSSHGVARDATEARSEAYRNGRKYHPDVSKEKHAEAHFKEVAKPTKSQNPDKRAAYDPSVNNTDRVSSSPAPDGTRVSNSPARPRAGGAD